LAFLCTLKNELMNWVYVIIPLTSALIGWLTIWVTIKLLFQRVIPKRRPGLAQKLGRLVSNELLSFSDIEEKITHPDSVKKILPQVETHIDTFLRQRLKEVFPMISMFIGDKTINQLKQVFMNELETLFPAVMKNYVSHLKQDLDLERIVTDKIMAFSDEQRLTTIYRSLSKEFRMAGMLGAGIGLITGLLQVLLIIILMG
jgi:uncharacterized membrane protein YheB (UPF0754 family)